MVGLINFNYFFIIIIEHINFTNFKLFNHKIKFTHSIIIIIIINILALY